MDVTKLELLTVFMTAFLIAAAVSPLAIWIAPRIGAMDVPKDNRRMHTHAMPRFGGLAIMVGAEITLLIFMHNEPKILAVMLGGLLMYLLGVIDDLKDLSAKIKFGWQILVAILMYAFGLKIEFITNYFDSGVLRFGSVLCFVVTILWIVGITNTINLIDGLDGLAAGVAAIACLSVAYVAYIHGDRFGMLIVCVSMVALAGACTGFLPFNFYPARIFMGDGGALFLGFMIAAFSVISPLKRSTLIAVIVPVLILGIPIFDTAFAIFRRVINRKPIMQADRGHLHHRLMASGYGQQRSVLMLYAISGIMGMAAVLVSRELIFDAVLLVIIASIFLYVFLTDPGHRMPQIKAVNVEEDEERRRREGEIV